MAKDKVKIEGLIIKKARENAPSFVKGQASVKVEEFIKFLRAQDKKGWVNFNILESREGGLYFELDTWEPSNTRPAAPAPSTVEEDDSLPF
ncbi:hypothetical protein [Pedobacter sp.]|uniref:hypothetical protein n=1 Tax=Pedobacter sp. TaxID=1411316 RepID=UPI003C34FB79